jgi:two-component system chemotaxis sensor kinase CheA
VGERHLAFEFRPIERDGALAALLCVVSDVTAEVAREKVEAEGREAVEVFERIMRDREGVTEMLLEAGEIVRTLTDVGEVHKLTVVEERRALHTLKGNAGIFGLKTFAAVCHDLESASLERAALLDAGERGTLREAWDRTVARMRKLLGHERAQLIAVDEREHAEIIDAVLNGAAPESIAQRLAAWRLESASQRLERMAEQAKKLAERLGKPAVTVQVQPNGVRLAKEHWSKLFAELVHVVRNAIDHGIESADERVAAGKAPVGNVTVRTSVKADRLHIEITDDGRGIDWERVRAKAQERGIAAETHSDLVSALFADGLSTRDEATETSGRGVGLAAVAATLQSLDGRVDVTTTPQEGTQFRFSLPYVDTEHAMQDFRRSQVIPQA